jgi:hypothetical protein
VAARDALLSREFPLLAIMQLVEKNRTLAKRMQNEEVTGILLRG